MTIDGKLVRQFGSFAGIGAIATLMQYALLVMAVEWTAMNAVLASSMAFLLSGALNYYLNYRFTFVSSNNHRAAAGRFAAVAGIGLILNALVMMMLIHWFGLPYMAAQLIATGFVLIWNFSGNAAWTFAAQRTQPDAAPGGGRK